MALSATVSAKINATQTASNDLSSATANLQKALSQVFTDGAGAGAINVLWSDQRTLAASASEDLDLAGALTNIYGAAAVFARIKAILVTASSGNTNNVNVIREGTNGVPLFLALGDGIPVKPGGAFLWIAPDATGIVVTASTGDLLTITNSGGTTGVTYDIVILGAAT